MLYAILNDTFDSIKEIKYFDVLPPHKPGRVLPIVIDELPSYDEESEKVIQGDYVIDDGVVRQTWIVVELDEAEAYQLAVEKGYTVSPESFTLRLQDRDRELFAQMTSLVNLALELGVITNSTEQMIRDIDGIEHTITTERFKEIMVDYGLYYQSLWSRT